MIQGIMDPTMTALIVNSDIKLKTQQNGQGTYIYNGGSKYVGEWKDGKFEGQGTITWSDGDKYVGEFKDGLRNGQGTNTNADGDKYVGEWKDNLKNGQGTYTNADGSIYHSGLWVDNEAVDDEEIDDDLIDGDIKFPSDSSSASKPMKHRGRKGKPHHGYDISADGKIFRKNGNVPLVVCNKSGVVTYSKWVKGYGNFVEIKHGENDYSAYGHLDSSSVTKGEPINVGDVIGVEGTTGHSDGDHVHFEFRVKRPKTGYGSKTRRGGDGAPDVEVNDFNVIRPISDVDEYYYYQVGDNSYSQT